MEVSSDNTSESQDQETKGLMGAFVHYLDEKGIEPGQVTISKIPVSLASLGLHQFNAILGVVTFVAGSAADILDGKLARYSNKTSREGALLDAMTDKLVNAFMYAYLLSQLNYQNESEYALLALMSLNVGLDLISQSIRGNLVQQFRGCFKAVLDPDSLEYDQGKSKEMANNAGKYKAWAQFMGVSTLMINPQMMVFQILSAISFSVSSVLAGKSILGRLNK